MPPRKIVPLKKKNWLLPALALVALAGAYYLSPANNLEQAAQSTGQLIGHVTTPVMRTVAVPIAQGLANSIVAPLKDGADNYEIRRRLSEQNLKASDDARCAPYVQLLSLAAAGGNDLTSMARRRERVAEAIDQGKNANCFVPQEDPASAQLRSDYLSLKLRLRSDARCSSYASLADSYLVQPNMSADDRRYNLARVTVVASQNGCLGS